MRHRKKIKKLGRSAKQRKALVRNLVCSLILYEKINTTSARASEVKKVTELLINKGKKQGFAVSRYLYKYLYDKNAVKKIIEDLSKQFKERKSGFIRTLKIGSRRGDAAPMVTLELILPHKEKVQEGEKAKVKKKIISKTKIKIEEKKKPTKITIREKKGWLEKAKGIGRIFRPKKAETKIKTRRTTSK